MFFQDLKVTNEPMMDSLVEAATRVLRSGRYIRGEEVSAFESELAAYCGARFCVAVSSGLDALRLILSAYMAMGRLKPGDEVIVPANTFIATFLAVTQCGLTAVAADIDPETFCLDFKSLPLSEATRAIIPVHLYGNPCWDAATFNSLRERGILIIEDNAQAVGAIAPEAGFHGSAHTGSLGDAAAISFYPTKNLGGLGDAGAVLTNDAELASTVRMLGNYGSEEKYIHELQGMNCRMDELQAALLRVKLPLLADVNRRRNEVAALYDRLIDNPEVTKPKIYRDGRHQVWHQYVIRHPRRDALRQYLADADVITEIHYPVACHNQPCYRDSQLLRTPSSLRHAETAAAEVLSLPIADATDLEIKHISDLINRFS